MKYIPSVAFSLCDHRSDADFEPLRPYVERITCRVLADGLPRGVCLNVNAPAAQTFRGIKVQRMGMGDWHEEWQESVHPHGWNYYWIAGYYAPADPYDESTDTWAYEHGYVTVTPLHLDLTAYDAMRDLKFYLE